MRIGICLCFPNKKSGRVGFAINTRMIVGFGFVKLFELIGLSGIYDLVVEFYLINSSSL